MMKRSMIRLSAGFLFLTGLLGGCAKAERLNSATAPAPIVVEHGNAKKDADGQEVNEQTEPSEEAELSEQQNDPEQQEDQTSKILPPRTPVKAKGIYVSAYVAGTPSVMDELIAEIDRTEANAVVIDLKDDFGRVVCNMDSELIQDVGSVKTYIPNADGLMKKLKSHKIYAIARIPAFRDAWLGEARPEWCIKKADGSLFKDRDGNSWLNPYCKEAWEYLVEIGRQAGKLGFDEVQFDYVRSCTEKGMKEAAFDEEQTAGRSRTDIICEFMEYAYTELREEGLFVSADVFGAIIGSAADADSVGQVYGEMAKHLDYISPMIYPSHYADGNYGIDHPDMRPYETVLAALEDSGKKLYAAGLEAEHIAEVRPWLQDFTASWLTNHIEYGPEEIRAQIQATYDAGYDEWLLWDASCKYGWDGLMTPAAAKAEEKQIGQSRAALLETSCAEETERAESEREESGSYGT